jgi:hypothetical protein
LVPTTNSNAQCEQLNHADSDQQHSLIQSRILAPINARLLGIRSIFECMAVLQQACISDTAPTIAEASKDDETYARLNLRMLRNPATVNLFRAYVPLYLATTRM